MERGGRREGGEEVNTDTGGWKIKEKNKKWDQYRIHVGGNKEDK